MNTLVFGLRYLFWPNPGFAQYTNIDMMAALILCAVLIIGSFGIGYWRRKQDNAIARKLSKSWSSVAFWFGIVGIILVVSRVEDIQFFAMRILWVIWAVLAIVYILFQWKKWRMKHYEVLPTVVSHDPRDRYLPRKKR